MSVCDLHNPIPPGLWGADWSRVCENYEDANEVISTHRPYLNISLRKLYGFPLNEMTYKQVAGYIDPNFLKQGIRAQALRGVRYSNIEKDTMVFYVSSSEFDINQTQYMNLIRFLDWDNICTDADLTPREKALMLLWTSNIQLHCDDPSFLYWGYQYILTQLGASVYPETRPPDKRNPRGGHIYGGGNRTPKENRSGIVCKHLNRVLRALPFYNGDIARVVRERFGGPHEKAVDQAIAQRETLQTQVNAGIDRTQEQGDENPGII
jgi:hypothetical protein